MGHPVPPPPPNFPSYTPQVKPPRPPSGIRPPPDRNRVCGSCPVKPVSSMIVKDLTNLYDDFGKADMPNYNIRLTLQDLIDKYTEVNKKYTSNEKQKPL